MIKHRKEGDSLSFQQGSQKVKGLKKKNNSLLTSLYLYTFRCSVCFLCAHSASSLLSLRLLSMNPSTFLFSTFSPPSVTAPPPPPVALRLLFSPCVLPVAHDPAVQPQADCGAHTAGEAALGGALAQRTGAPFFLLVWHLGASFFFPPFSLWFGADSDFFF